MESKRYLPSCVALKLALSIVSYFIVIWNFSWQRLYLILIRLTCQSNFRW